MNCPSCQLELTDSQLACPRCGYLPGFGPSAAADGAAPPTPEELTVPVPDPADALTEPVDTSWAAEWEPGTPEPTLAFASPQQYAATHPSSGYPAQPAFLPPGQVPPAAYGQAAYGQGAPAPVPDWMSATPPKRRKLLLPILLLSLVVLVAGSGVALAGHYFLGWFGGGRRPADVLPGSAVSYVQVDLNPSLVQQASAWQFLRDLPQVKEASASGAPDPKAVCWKLLTSSGNPFPEVDYERDLKPWLGDRLGVAMVPAASGAASVLAIEVKDEAKARQALADLSPEGGPDYDITMRSGFALLTMTTDTKEVLAALDAGALSANQTFATDFASLGDPGVLAGWSDLAGTAKLGQQGPRQPFVQGRAVYALGFAPDTMTLSGKAVDLGDTGITGTADLGLLPASTWAAVGFAGGGKALQAVFPSVEPYLKDALEGSGLVEDDLVALLGRSLSLGLASTGPESTLPSMPDMGVRIESDDAARAKVALNKLLDATGGGVPVVSRVDGDVLVASTSERYLSELAVSPSSLSDDPTFAKAVPDHGRATAALYVKFAPLWTDNSSVEGEYKDFLTSLQAFGGGYVADGAGSGSWSLRVVRS